MDNQFRSSPKDIVKKENMATVWATSTHLIPLLTGLTGLSNAHIHWKKRATTIPRKVGRRCSEHGLAAGVRGNRTVRYGANEKTSEAVLLLEVHPDWDMWSVRNIGPGSSPMVGHGSDVRDSGDFAEGWMGWGRGVWQTKRSSKLFGRG